MAVEMAECLVFERVGSLADQWVISKVVRSAGKWANGLVELTVFLKVANAVVPSVSE